MFQLKVVEKIKTNTFMFTNFFLKIVLCIMSEQHGAGGAADDDMADARCILDK